MNGITREYTVWCSVCCNWERSVEVKIVNAKKEFKAHGWKNTKNGWICSKCANNTTKMRKGP